MSRTPTVAVLHRVSEGLLYPSETDVPWTAFSWPTAKGEPTGEGVRQLGGHDANSLVEERDIGQFFAPLIEDKGVDGNRAIEARYHALFVAVQEHIINPKVIRVGEIDIAVYVVGKAKEGGWVGLRTRSVET